MLKAKSLIAVLFKKWSGIYPITKAAPKKQDKKVLLFKSLCFIFANSLLLQSCCKSQDELDNYYVESIHYGVSVVPESSTYSRMIVNKEGKIHILEEIRAEESKTKSKNNQRNIIYASSEYIEAKKKR